MRRPLKFQSSDGTVVYTFSNLEMEWQSEQAFLGGLARIAGADYPHDYHGLASSPRDSARERIRCAIVGANAGAVEAGLDDARGTCTSVGKGKLFLTDSDDALRWAWARLFGMPSMTIGKGMYTHTFLIFDFLRLSDWHPTDAYDEEFPVDATTESFTVTNPGNLPTWDPVIRIRANDTNAVTFPVTFENNRNGMSFTLDRADFTTANEELRIDCEHDLVEYSDDNGATYAADPGTIELPAGQTRIMRFEPGANPIEVTTAGTPDYDIDIDFEPNMA